MKNKKLILFSDAVLPEGIERKRKKVLRKFADSKITPTFAAQFRKAGCKEILVIHIGKVVEWSITAVLKTAVPRGTGGSNPSLSAETPDFTSYVESGLFLPSRFLCRINSRQPEHRLAIFSYLCSKFIFNTIDK